MQTKQAKSYNPGTTPVPPVYAERPDCPIDGPQCTWVVTYDRWSLKYINAACLKHYSLGAVRNGVRVSNAA